MSFYLKKEFWDTSDGIESVVIHYTSSPLGTRPDWTRAESRAMAAGERLRTGVGEVAKYGPPAPQTPQFVHPRLRKKVLTVPSDVYDWRINGWSRNFSFHYFYEIVQSGQRRFTPVLSEEIASREVILIDALGISGGACTNWSIYDWDAPQFSPMEDPQFTARFGANHPLEQLRFYSAPLQDAFGVAKKAALDTLPLPHAFRARVSAPVGATVRLRFHVGNWGLPEFQRWESYILTNESFVMAPNLPPLVYAPWGTQPAPQPVSRVSPELLFGNPYAPLLPGYQAVFQPRVPAAFGWSSGPVAPVWPAPSSAPRVAGLAGV
ncbi:MAG TPA: hypothetical protein VHL09_02600 [Dehalococcoidia bacterium]|nr:hypothetical protein [Dehalococcoidia bacterium]